MFFNFQKWDELYTPLEQIILFTIVGAITITLLLILLILFYRLKSAIYDKRNKEIRAEAQLLVADFIFSEENNDFSIRKNNAQNISNIAKLNLPYNRKVFLEVILNFNKNTLGKPKDVLRKLYFDLKYDDDSLKKTRSYFWHIRAKGIQELSEMEVQMHFDELEHFLDDSNIHIRTEAYNLLFNKYDFELMDSLEMSKYKLTEWQQIRFFSHLTHTRIKVVPNLSFWLNSSNESFTLLIVRLIAYYKQDESEDKLIQLLTFPSEKVVIECIKTLSILKSTKSVPTFIEEFKDGNIYIQREIIKALGVIGSSEALEFLKTNLNKASFLNTMESVKALQKSNLIDNNLEELVATYNNGVEIEQVIKHVKDSRI